MSKAATLDIASPIASLDRETDAFAFAAVNGQQGLQSIASEWRTLVEAIPSARYFQFPEWHLANLAGMESDPARVWFVTARQRGRLVGVLPLRHESRRVWGIRVRTLRTITHTHATLSDFAFARATEGVELFRQFIRWLRRQRTMAWDELSLEGIPDESAIAYAVRAAPPALLVEEIQARSACLVTEGTPDQALAAVSGSFKRNLRRLARRAEQTAALTYRIMSDDSDLDSALETFLEIEASGWKGSDGAGSAIRLDPGRKAFYLGLRREFARLGACRINLLEHGAQAVAAQFCLTSAGILSVLKIGFLESHAAFAPGNLIMEATIAACCSDPSLRSISFVTDPPWAHLWKPGHETVWRFRAYHGAWGLMLYWLLVIKRWHDARTATGKDPAPDPGDASPQG